MAQFNFESLNKEQLFKFDVSAINNAHPQTEAERKEHDDRYTNLESLYKENGEDKVYQIKALYINTKSVIEEVKEAPVVALATIYVNLPVHQLGAVKSMRDDKNAVRAINMGYAGFTIRPYQKERGKKKETYYEAKWCTVDPEDFEDIESDEDFT